LPNRVDAAFGAGLTVALSTICGSMPAMMGGGLATNSIEEFLISYWLGVTIRP
jgi:hypothetical protein